jgi:hypothetical protein
MNVRRRTPPVPRVTGGGPVLPRDGARPLSFAATLKSTFGGFRYIGLTRAADYDPPGGGAGA